MKNTTHESNNRHERKWLIISLISLLLLITGAFLIGLNIGTINGRPSDWIMIPSIISLISFLVFLVVWLILKLKKWAILPIICLILIIIGIYLLAKKELTKLNTNSERNSISETSTLTTPAWNRYYSTIGKFSIEFPCIVKVTSTKKDLNTTNTIYTCTGIADEYVVGLVAFSAKPFILDSAGEQGFLEQLVQGEIWQNYQLKSSSFSEFKNHQSIDFLMYSTKTQTYTKGKSFYIQSPTTTYFFFLSATSISINDVDFNYFVNSFQILD